MKPEEKDIIKEIYEYLMLARSSHANLPAMVGGEAGRKNLLEPLEKLLGPGKEESKRQISKVVVIGGTGLAATGLALWLAYKRSKKTGAEKK